jgi:gas vesicle protein
MSDNNTGNKLLIFLLGGAIGAGLCLLFAPQSGKETRKKVKIFFDDIGEKTGELVEDGNETAVKFVRSATKAFRK